MSAVSCSCCCWRFTFPPLNVLLMWPLFVQRVAADFVHMLRRGTDHPDARYLPSILSFTLTRFLFSAFIPPLLLPLLLSSCHRQGWTYLLRGPRARRCSGAPNATLISRLKLIIFEVIFPFTNPLIYLPMSGRFPVFGNFIVQQCSK